MQEEVAESMVAALGWFDLTSKNYIACFNKDLTTSAIVETKFLICVYHQAIS